MCPRRGGRCALLLLLVHTAPYVAPRFNQAFSVHGPNVQIQNLGFGCII